MIIRHKINRISALKTIPAKFGVEIDIRGFSNKILLSHDPIESSKKYDELEDFLLNFNHSLLVINIKESGYEKEIINLTSKYHIHNYFFLDVEYPFIYKSTRLEGFRKIAIRFSEYEPIHFINAQIDNGKPLVDWIWIDCFNKFPIKTNHINILTKFKICFVCPSRWGKSELIESFQKMLLKLNLKLDAVMTEEEYIDLWEHSGVMK